VSDDPELRVPPKFLEILKRASRLPDEADAALRSALDTDRKSYERSDLVDGIVEALTSWSRQDADRLLEVLLSLHGVRRALRIHSAGPVAVAIAHSEGLDLAEADAAVFVDRLTSLLEARAIRLSARAQDLLNEYEHTFIDARILSDVRVLFDRQHPEVMDAATVSHSLRLRYNDVGPQVIYIALSRVDLQKLRDLADRALVKADALEGLVRSIGVPYVQPQREAGMGKPMEGDLL
jgi:hypothetical protein